MHTTSHVVARNASPFNTTLYRRSDPAFDPNPGGRTSTSKRSGVDKDIIILRPPTPRLFGRGKDIIILRPPTRRLFGRDKEISARDDLSSEPRDLLERDGLVDDI